MNSMRGIQAALYSCAALGAPTAAASAEEAVDRTQFPGQAIPVGFRAEAFSPAGYGLTGDNEIAAIERTVTLPEPPGTETLLYTQLGGKEVQGKILNPRPAQPGGRMTFNLDLTRLHVFDKASGKSVLV
ncbi:hypothetical protein K32_04780 [Kaistia sp. 32K]|uniref:hypothetical protein n=1 Tax=Kaistia sp. 32K TaxID=2795690 RepID=UPI001915AAA1|nr:hypothetical protein [Kaistia sp. 32K]BCP51861.1 hypothetical protein K32_04780 [Kaistia sp. 32K]